MSPEARARMRRRERDVYDYYDDMGPGKGNCTWGTGILAHKGPCSKEELVKPVSAAAVEAELSRRMAAAEAGGVRNVRRQKLSQEQFDALVSLTFNAGVTNSMTSAHVGGKKVVARGLIARRAEESAPFRAAPEASVAVVKK